VVTSTRRPAKPRPGAAFAEGDALGANESLSGVPKGPRPRDRCRGASRRAIRAAGVRSPHGAAAGQRPSGGRGGEILPRPHVVADHRPRRRGPGGRFVCPSEATAALAVHRARLAWGALILGSIGAGPPLARAIRATPRAMNFGPPARRTRSWRVTVGGASETGDPFRGVERPWAPRLAPRGRSEAHRSPSRWPSDAGPGEAGLLGFSDKRHDGRPAVAAHHGLVPRPRRTGGGLTLCRGRCSRTNGRRRP